MMEKAKVVANEAGLVTAGDTVVITAGIPIGVPGKTNIVKADVKAILNFAPINLKVPSDVHVRNENMAMELEYLSFAMVNNHAPKGAGKV